MKRIFILSGSSIALSVGAWLFATKLFFYQNEQPLKITAQYMRYACGNCYPQWNVTKAENAVREIIGEDVEVVFKGKPIEENLSSEENEALITYTFSFTGRLKSTISNRYIFEADKYEYTVN